MRFPVSVKGVLFDRDRVLLLGNERAEWELPGGRLEAGETIAQCLAREVEEELGIGVEVGPLLDCWIYEVLPGRSVLIVTHGLRRLDSLPLRLSAEHKALDSFTLAAIEGLPMPEGYRRSIRRWAAMREAATA